KPDPEGYLSAAETLGVPISECLVIEDSLTGITSGLASGAYVLAVPHLFDVAVQERMVILPSLQGQSLGSIESLYR
ncbi:MAG: HAD-IA family hydrolase, partial [Actinobacteria bacterium]|nr:HAD-IA family hydrolase [Actinomycetota bacterium]